MTPYCPKRTPAWESRLPVNSSPAMPSQPFAPGSCEYVVTNTLGMNTTESQDSRGIRHEYFQLLFFINSLAINTWGRLWRQQEVV